MAAPMRSTTARCRRCCPRWSASPRRGTSGPARERWSLERLRENDEHGTMLGIGVALLLLALRPLLSP